MNHENKNDEGFPPGCEEKMRYVKEDGLRWLDSTVSAYEAVSAKAMGLFGIAVPLIAALLGFAFATAVSGSPTLGRFVFPAFLYAGGLTVSSALLLGVFF